MKTQFKVLANITVIAVGTFALAGNDEGSCNPSTTCYRTTEPRFDPNVDCSYGYADCRWDDYFAYETAWIPDGRGGEFHDCYYDPDYGNCDRIFTNCDYDFYDDVWVCEDFDAFGWYTETFYYADDVPARYLDFECDGYGDWVCDYQFDIVAGGWTDCLPPVGVCEGDTVYVDVEVCR